MAASIGRFSKPNKNIVPALMRRHNNGLNLSAFVSNQSVMNATQILIGLNCYIPVCTLHTT